MPYALKYLLTDSQTDRWHISKAQKNKNVMFEETKNKKSSHSFANSHSNLFANYHDRYQCSKGRTHDTQAQLQANIQDPRQDASARASGPIHVKGKDNRSMFAVFFFWCQHITYYNLHNNDIFVTSYYLRSCPLATSLQLNDYERNLQI